MKKDIWIFLFVIGVILFSWPIIGIFTYGLAQYLFTAWFVFIALIFFITVYSKKWKNGG
jgi:hypothetical protein